jgi:twitching motility protein PilU
LIREGNVTELKDVMSKSNQQGMNTFDQALYELYKAKKITYDVALHHADSANELRLMIKLGNKGGVKEMNKALRGVRLMDVDEN